MATYARDFWEVKGMPGVEMHENFTVFIGSTNRYVEVGCTFEPGCEKLLVPRALHIIDCQNTASLDTSSLLTELFETYF